ncbi:MAG TPA: hypothetical protein VMH80_10815 [Bryobacteraceae bacterium]|nr:hypothetical protein [Bryobacteraceae bacterium]
MIIRCLVLACTFATCALAQGSAGTTLTFTRDYHFPPVGLASSETAQLNLVNVATSSGPLAPACTGTLTFTNAGGKAIGSPVNFTTSGSQILSTQLTFAELAPSGTRGEFTASVQLTYSAESKTPTTGPCSLVVSLETFDTSTGVTHVYLGSSVGGITTPILSPFGSR